MKKIILSLSLLIITSLSSYGADFSVEFFPADNSINDAKVSGISSAKITDLSTVLIDYQLKSQIPECQTNQHLVKVGGNFLCKTNSIVSIHFGSGANCSAVCSSGLCNICKIQGATGLTVQKLGTGGYRINGMNGTKYLCNGTGVGTSYSSGFFETTYQSSTYAHVQFGSGGSAVDVGNGLIICHYME